jgi:hypothetical protein
MVKIKTLNEQLEGTYFYSFNPYIFSKALYVFHKGKAYCLALPHTFKVSLKDKRKLLKEMGVEYPEDKFKQEFDYLINDKLNKPSHITIKLRDGTLIYTNKYIISFMDGTINLFNNDIKVATIKLEEILEMYYGN